MTLLAALRLATALLPSPTPLPVDEYAVLVQDTPSREERLFVEAVRQACPHGDSPRADFLAVLGLFRLEEVLGAREWRRGILAGVFCIEAGLNPDVQWGDYRELAEWPGRAIPMAHGPYQLWLPYRRWCSLTPDGAQDLFSSARCWVALVEDLAGQEPYTRCKWSHMVAEATRSNVHKYGRRCNRKTGMSAHWRVAEDITRRWEELQQETAREKSYCTP